MSGKVERAIMDEIRAWSKHALEEKNPYFNNLPACPYARKAWAENQVRFVFKYESSAKTVFEELCDFNDSYELVIVVDMNYPENVERFHSQIEWINDFISEGMFDDKDLWVMGFHPNDEVNELVDQEGFDPLVELEYAMIFIQRLGRVQDASDKLKKLGYYDKYFEEYNVEEIFERRNALHRRLKNGNETT
jgi:hypothetical protein